MLNDALAWLEPQLPTDEALAILSTPRPESVFQWYRVTAAMGHSRYQLPDAMAPLKTSEERDG